MKNGFTLLELSLSLIIVALLIAAISGGVNLIKIAEYKSVIQELQTMQTAYKAFQGRYHNIPGDFDGATAIWPAINCEVTVDACNGNGDGVIETSDDANDEAKAALKHLSLAGMVAAYIEPIDVSSGAGMVINSSAVESKAGFGGLYLVGGKYIDKSIAISVGNPLDANNAVFIGGEFRGDNLVTATFTPAEAFAIDEKMDDGTAYGQNNLGASTGKFRAVEGKNTPNNACRKPAPLSASLAYQMAEPSPVCIIGFQLD